MALSLNDMLTSALQGSANSANAARKDNIDLAGIIKQLSANTATSNAATDAVASNTVAVNDQALKGAQQAQDATRQFAAGAGTDIQSPDNILIGLGQKLRQQVELAQKTQQVIQQKQSVNIVDHPVDWLTGQLTLKQDYQTYNNAADAANLTSDNIKSLTEATDEVQRTQLSLAQKITDASRTAAANATIAQATKEKAAANENQLGHEVTIAGIIQKNTAEQAKAAQEQFGLYMQGEQFKQEQAKFAIYKQQVSLEAANARLKAADTKDKADVEAKLLAQYNIGANALGYPQESNWKLIEAKAALGGTDATRISAAMESGGTTIIAGGSPRVTATPGGAAELIAAKVYPRANDPMFSPMKKFLSDTFSQELAAQPAVKGREGLAVQATNAAVAVATKNYTDNAVAPGSFYAPPAISSITAAQSVQSTDWYKKVLSTSGKDLTTAAPTPIIKLTTAAVESGVLTPEQAARGVAEFYGQAVAINNLTNRYAQVGIAPQSSMKVTPDINGLDTTPVDLTDYTQVLRMIAMSKAAQSDLSAGTLWRLQHEAKVQNLPAK